MTALRHCARACTRRGDAWCAWQSHALWAAAAGPLLRETQEALQALSPEHIDEVRALPPGLLRATVFPNPFFHGWGNGPLILTVRLFRFGNVSLGQMRAEDSNAEVTAISVFFLSRRSGTPPSQ